MRSSSNSSSSRYPFTPTQWQELEHQALIYKYIASGIPVPPDLLLPIRRSFLFGPAAPGIPPYYSQPGMGWSCFEMGGCGRKAEDPEPGRCRRTDGKKWRCAKEAYPDSKYCERHMHRGKNRSRKPVEISLNNHHNNNNNRTAAAAATPSFSLPLSAHDSSYYPHPYYTHNATSEQRENNKKLCYGGGGSAWELMPLGLGEPKPKRSAATHYYSNGEEEEEKKHCFVLGADFKLGSSKEEEERPLRRFLDDRREDPWMLAPKTHLSISVPMGGLHPSHLINGSCE